MKKPEVTIATVNWNGVQFVKDFFTSITKQKFPRDLMEIIMVDNGSTDGSKEFVKKNFPFVKIIELDKNYGFTEACNLAYRASTSPLFLESGNDTIMPEDFVANMVSEIRRLGVAVVVAKDYPVGSNLSGERPADTVNIICGNAVGVHGDYDFPAIPRGSFIIDKIQTGEELFDGDYFAYGEDTWLGFRLLLTGKKARYSNTCRLWHYGAATGSRLQTLNFYTERNRLLNILTFFSYGTILKIFPIMVFDFLVKFFAFLFTLNFQRLSNFLKAYGWLLLNFQDAIKKRRVMQSKRIERDDAIIATLSYKLYGYQRKEKNIFLQALDKMVELYCRIVRLKVYESAKASISP